jgi:hypothetical protein
MSAANWKAWNPLMTSKLSSRHGRRSIAPMRRYADAAGNAPAGDLDHALGGVDATDLGAPRDRGEPEVPRIDDASTPASIPVARAFGPSLQTLALDGGCRVKPSRKCCCSVAETAPRAGRCHDVGTDEPRVTDGVADFGTQP